MPGRNIHLTWTEQNSPNNQDEIYYMSYDSVGTIVVPRTRLTYYPSSSQTQSIDVDANNQPRIIWTDDRDGNLELYEKHVDPNLPPVITSIPLTQAKNYQPYNYQVQASDPNGDPLIYSLALAPANMTINPSTGLIQWTPQYPRSIITIGKHVGFEIGFGSVKVPVSVQVADPFGEIATQNFVIKVSNYGFKGGKGSG